MAYMTVSPHYLSSIKLPASSWYTFLYILIGMTLAAYLQFQLEHFASVNIIVDNTDQDTDCIEIVMACNACTKNFGLFLKEDGCPSCKYSFCSKCLKYRTKIDGKSKYVCLRCYELSKSSAGSNCVEETPSKSPLNSCILDTPVDTVPTVVGINPLTVHPKESSTETEIRERLAALKRKDDEHQSDGSVAGSSLADMEKRLAALKGIEYKDYAEANKNFLTRKDGRSEEQQITDLMKQFVEEQEIHASIDSYNMTAIEEIEIRLAALKDIPSRKFDKNRQPNSNDHCPDNPGDDDSEENEEEAAQKLAARFLQEASIDAKNHSLQDDDQLDMVIPTPLDPSETEELPWCTICNEDAFIRCVSCGGDLFCISCFKECHCDDEDYQNHKTKPFKALEKKEV